MTTIGAGFRLHPGRLDHGPRRRHRGTARRAPAAAAEVRLACGAAVHPPPALPLAAAPGGANAIARLGPSYVKLGQFLATRPDVVGNDIALDLAMLQDKMETFPQARGDAADRSVARPQGRRSLCHFGDAVAAASIAQVHPAEVLIDGVADKVAVKVIRPGVRRRFFHDLQSYFLAARLQEKYIPSSAGCGRSR